MSEEKNASPKSSWDDMVQMIVDLRRTLADTKAELVLCRDELCLYCGQYKERHKGACDGCRWKDV